jgi:hypothetical protein
LEAEDVTTLDELAAQLDPSGIESEAQEAVPEGWTRIVFPDSPAKEPPKPEVLQPTGGDAIAQVVAQWAGLPSRSPAAFIVQPPPTGEPAKEAGAEPEPAAVSSGEQPEDPPTFAASTLSQPVTHSGRADWTVPPRTAARLPMPHREARRSEPAAFPEPKDSRTQPPAQWETTPRFRLAASRPIRAAAGPGARVQVRWPEVSPPEEPAPTPNIFRIAPSLTVGSAAWPVEQAHPERHSESMAAPPAIPDDPFADSALEERLAGVFERAARESGVDVL